MGIFAASMFNFSEKLLALIEDFTQLQHAFAGNKKQNPLPMGEVHQSLLMCDNAQALASLVLVCKMIIANNI